MKRLLSTIAVLGAMTTAAQAKIELKGWYWGKPMEKSYHRSKDTLAGVPAEWQIYADLNQPKLRAVSITITFKPDRFKDVKEALMTKYKLTCDTKRVQNKMGAVFLDERCGYTEDGDQLVLSKYDGKISQSAIRLFNVEELKQWSENQKKKNRRDL